MLVIVTASGTVTLRQYAEAWQSVKAAPAGTRYKSSLCGWWSASREEILRQFQAGLHDRINIRGGLNHARGRKDDRDQFWRYWRDSRAVRRIVTERLVVRQFETAEARKRFSHLLTRED